MTLTDHKAYCRRGHTFDTDNTYVAPDGERGCRLCRRLARSRHKARTAHLVPRASTEWHRLSEIDQASGTAICSKCGPTRVRVRPGRNTCYNKTRAHRRTRDAKRFYRTYGLTYGEWDRILLVQEGRCGICGLPANLIVDHDHTTGGVRGLLCHRCNVAIGQLGDTVTSVRQAVRYLENGERL